MELTATPENIIKVINHLADQISFIHALLAGLAFFSIFCIVWLAITVEKLKKKLQKLSPKNL